MNRFGIVIVTYNSEAEIGACLDSCLDQNKLGAVPIVVVDNNSSDGTCREVEKRVGVRLLANESNTGFAAAANLGIRTLGSGHILLLNPDAQLVTSVDPLLDGCDCEDVAVVSGRLVDEKNEFQAGWALRRFPTPAALAFEALGLNRMLPGNPVNRRYRCLDLDPETAADVEQPAGAFLMIRRQAWEDLGGFDEAFWPLWFEDVDFLKRARDKGYRIKYEPVVIARHKGGHSVKSSSWEYFRVCWYGSLLRYACKHFGVRSRQGVSLAVILGFTARAVVQILWKRSLKPAVACIHVMRMAVSAACSCNTVVPKQLMTGNEVR